MSKVYCLLPMKHTKNLLSALLLVMSVISPSVQALTVADAVNSMQAAPPSDLPSVANPRGNIGYILSTIFYGSSDGALNGKIKPQYLDLSGVSSGGGTSQWTTTGSSIYYGSTVGIGTSNPNTAYTLDVAGGIRASNGITITAGSVSLPTGAISSNAIADGSLLFADWNQN